MPQDLVADHSTDWLAAATGVAQLADSVACAIPAPFIVAALDRVDCPPEVRRVLPVAKAASGLGLLAGLARPRIGVAASSGLIAYFIAAIGFHVRARDSAAGYVPPVWMLALSVVLCRRFAGRARAASGA